MAVGKGSLDWWEALADAGVSEEDGADIAWHMSFPCLGMVTAECLTVVFSILTV
jgi:hypothetical protein